MQQVCQAPASRAAAGPHLVDPVCAAHCHRPYQVPDAGHHLMLLGKPCLQSGRLQAGKGVSAEQARHPSDIRQQLQVAPQRWLSPEHALPAPAHQREGGPAGTQAGGGCWGGGATVATLFMAAPTRAFFAAAAAHSQAVQRSREAAASRATAQQPAARSSQPNPPFFSAHEAQYAPQQPVWQGLDGCSSSGRHSGPGCALAANARRLAG